MKTKQRIEKAKAKIKELEEAIINEDQVEIEILAEYLESAFSKIKKLEHRKQLMADIFDRLQRQNKITFNNKGANQ